VAFELWKIFILEPINVLTVSLVDSKKVYFLETALTFEYKLRIKINKGSISSTFYKRFLRKKILKAPKETDHLTEFLRFWDMGL